MGNKIAYGTQGLTDREAFAADVGSRVPVVYRREDPADHRLHIDTSSPVVAERARATIGSATLVMLIGFGIVAATLIAARPGVRAPGIVSFIGGALFLAGAVTAANAAVNGL